MNNEQFTVKEFLAQVVQPKLESIERKLDTKADARMVDAIMAEREKRVTQLELDAKGALQKAETALERRLDLLNEFRAQSSEELAPLKVQAARSQTELGMLGTQLDALKERVDVAAGGRATLISFAATAIALLSIAAQFIR